MRGTPLNGLFETLSELRDILVTFYTKVGALFVLYTAILLLVSLAVSQCGVVLTLYQHLLA